MLKLQLQISFYNIKIHFTKYYKFYENIYKFYVNITIYINIT